MVVTAPEGSQPGSMIQIAAPAAAPTVTGVPVSAGGAAMGVGVAPGVVGVAPGVVIVEAPPEGFVEVDEISPAGWFCLIVGCFFWPGSTSSASACASGGSSRRAVWATTTEVAVRG